MPGAKKRGQSALESGSQENENSDDSQEDAVQTVFLALTISWCVSRNKPNTWMSFCRGGWWERLALFIKYHWRIFCAMTNLRLISMNKSTSLLVWICIFLSAAFYIKECWVIFFLYLLLLQERMAVGKVQSSLELLLLWENELQLLAEETKLLVIKRGLYDSYSWKT